MHQRVRSTLIVGVAAAAASFGAGHLAPAHASAAQDPPGFAEPTPAGVFGNGFETDIRLDDTNPQIMYEAAPQSLSSTISTLQRSTDGGLTWKLVPGQDSGLLAGKNTTCPIGGGDVEVDSANGSLYYTDLTLAPGFSVARSDTQGNDFTAGTNCAGTPTTGTDRPWLTHFGDPKNPAVNPANGEFMVYDLVDQSLPSGTCPAGTSPAQNVLVVDRSPFFSDATGTTAGIQYGGPTILSCDEGIMGNDETFDYGAAGGGPEFYDIHDNNALNDISVVRCDIGAATATNQTGLSNCVDNVVATFPGGNNTNNGQSCSTPPASATEGACVTGANFPTMAVDDHGNLFAVWEEAPGTRGNATGNTLLYYSTSTDKGTIWTSPVELPTGEDQNVFAWPGAGDPGRIDVAFYGAPEAETGTAGPDSTNGHYGLYLAQNITGSYPLDATGWTTTLASEHFIHYGTMYTLIGGQTGNRTLGDFLQMRVGPQGEANISFSDSNNQDSVNNPEPMYVRQNSGPSLYAGENGTGLVSLPAAPTGNCVTGDPASADDATFDAADTLGSNNPNLDITKVCMSEPDPTHYQVTMTIADLTSISPGADAGGTTLLWQTQWHEPSSSDTTNGGALLFVYAESTGGGAPTCWDGQSAEEAVGPGGIGTGGGVEITYPGVNQLTGSACQVNQAAPGTITITAPISDFSAIVPHPDSQTLYSVTASTQTLAATAEDPPVVSGIGGQLFNVIDAAPAFDFTPSQGPQIPEAPWVPALLGFGTAAALGAGVVIRRRKGRDIL